MAQPVTHRCPVMQGVGDRIEVTSFIDGELGDAWDVASSWMSLDGVPLTYVAETEMWELVVSHEAHSNLIGERTLEGAIVDEAGNETPVNAALFTSGDAWPSVTIDARAPNLSVSPKLDRCDGYAPAVEADNRLHVKGHWDMAVDCPESWGAESCTDPASPEETRISAPIRMTFLLDEALNHDLSSVYVTQGDTSKRPRSTAAQAMRTSSSLGIRPRGRSPAWQAAAVTASVARASIAAIAQRTAACVPSQAAATGSVSPSPMRACIRSLCLHLRWILGVGSTSTSTPETPSTGPIQGRSVNRTWPIMRSGSSTIRGKRHLNACSTGARGPTSALTSLEYYTMTAEIWTNADWFTYQISIYVAAAEGAEDCELRRGLWRMRVYAEL